MELITICISTLNRFAYLKELVSSIIDLDLGELNIKVDVIIVDNDSNASSQLILDEFKVLPDSFSVSYYVEFVKGIPQSRNLAVSKASKLSKFLIFVDDDEYVDKFWLKNLLLVQQTFNADLVCGPVLPIFHPNCPRWIIDGGFFHRLTTKNLKTGDERLFSATNNLLVVSSWLFSMDKPFNENMALTGGSDIELTKRLHQKGAKIIWAKKAIVYEWVPVERANIKYILRRGFRLGNETFRLSEDKSIKFKIKAFFNGVARILWGILLFIPSAFFAIFFGFHIFVKNLRILVRGIGFISGIFGYDYLEYKK